VIRPSIELEILKELRPKTKTPALLPGFSITDNVRSD